jgi:signal transduction histidine kinase/DNA-binding response OmpR family regulator/ligand-binding sensor domain-containing protein
MQLALFKNNRTVIQKLKQIFFWGLILLALQNKASESYFPQLGNPVLESWRWTNFPEFDSIRIQCLVKGKDGGMWLGTGNKVVFYDGYKTNSFIADNSNIQALILEKDNSLLTTTSNGLFRFKDGKFSQILDFKFNSQRNFFTDSAGDIWIGSDYGLLQITSNTIYCLNPDGYFEISSNGSVVNILKLENGNDYHLNSVKEIAFPVYNLTINDQGHVWMTIGKQEKNLAFLNFNEQSRANIKWKFIKIPGIATGSISGICEANNSVYVTSSDVNIMLARYQINSEKWESINMKAIGGDNVQSSIVQTTDGIVWIGGHSKLYALKNSVWKVYQYPDVALPLSYIDLTTDQENNLYLCGNDGSLLKLDLSAQRFRTYLGLNFQCNDAEGNFWFTTHQGEVVECDRNMQKFKKFTTADGLMNMTMALYFSKKSGLWAAGSNQSKAAIARFKNDVWRNTDFPELYLGIAYNGICELGDTAMAFPVNGVPEQNNAKYLGGFVTFNYQHLRWRAYTREKVPQRIPSMGQTSDGRLWFAGNDFQVYDGKSSQKVDLQSRTSNWTDDVRVSPSDQIWVARGGTGLYHFNGKKWEKLNTFNGLASNMVTNILIENDSSIYIASDKGISFFDGKQFTPQIIHPELNIQRERGNLRKSDNGALWINQATREWYLYDFKSTVEDPEIFKTTMYLKENHAPKTNLSFSNHEISTSGNVIITYTGSDYWNQTPSDKIQFSTRLNGKEWSLFSIDRSAIFLDLDAGDYTLEVRSRDLDGNIEPVPAQISFNILPPVYFRAWFILTILTFLGIIIWLLIRLYARDRQIHELDQLKLRLFTDISHELKTPLTLISLPLQKLLNKAEQQQENKGSLELIYANVQRLTNLVNQVVDFRRLEAGKIQLEISPGDLILHLRNIANYYTPLAHEKNIRFEFHSNLQEIWVKYDADKLEKIVVNLLSNAFKYTPENEKVQLLVQIDLPVNQIELWVNDSGPGIPQEMQQNIFDRFYRLRNEKINRIPGSGIGLSLVKELVNLYQGSIEVISDGLHGTTFHVKLPVTVSEKVVNSTPQENQDVDFSKFETTEKPIILLIEDEEPMLRFVTIELSNYFDVKGFGSVEKAFEWLDIHMPDLIISDVMLPGATGMEFCRKLKSQELTSHLPVILLTARDSEEDIVAGLGSGADAYMTKPFRMNELIARCFNLIENRRRLRERFADQDEIKPDTFTQSTTDQEFLEKAIRIVFENLDNSEFDVPQFCQEIHMSKTLLYSKLKSLTGQSATEFVRNIRLKEAKKLLVNNGNHLTIAEISYRVGFNDPLYFSRCFRKYFGFPPSETGK